ncbi:hypothetical protein NM688_g8989 [Phlebia brevispora]|uniref:Uncharacterized protein n=1 Tax=Phlebia brevispora TaxID=194682 RepID=A0ACC1RKQ0_9APHY|nr:hypothetical protein NM688_g8989 [Phlebia brevispora]
MTASAHINPSPDRAQGVLMGSSLNQQGQALYNRGQYSEAEKVFKEALDVKLRALGPQDYSTGIGYNALGETYIRLGRLDEAEENIKKAIPLVSSSAHDSAYYRENLAKVYEMKHDLVKAKEERLQGSPNSIICAEDNCTVFPLPHPLKYCSRCQSIYYCSEKCQRSDWKRHKKFCQSPAN